MREHTKNRTANAVAVLFFGEGSTFLGECLIFFEKINALEISRLNHGKKKELECV